MNKNVIYHGKNESIFNNYFNILNAWSTTLELNNVDSSFHNTKYSKVKELEHFNLLINLDFIAVNQQCD